MVTVLIDDRGGAKKNGDPYPIELQRMLPDSILTRLESADVAFEGHGGVTIGIELKRLTDALSCMYTGRLADTQLPLMAQTYDIRYLIIEDLYREEPQTGVLQRYKGELGKWGNWYDAHAGRSRTMYSSFQMWLRTLTEETGTRLERTADLAETAALIRSLYTWHQRGQHKSMRVLHDGNGALSRPTTLRRILALLPHVGWERSQTLCQRFRTLQQAMEAPPEAWYIEGELAAKSVADIMEVLHHG